MMTIDIWADFVCPFCYIGKHNFDEALADFVHRDDIQVTYKSFQLDPDTPKYDGTPYVESLAKKFGSVEKAREITSNVTEQARAVGLTFDFENGKPTNTFDAHRLNLYAQSQNNKTFAELAFHGHFVDGLDIGDFATLTDLAEQAGLDKNQAQAVLEDETSYHDDVKEDIKQAASFSISGVPFFIIDQKYSISGAQPTDTFSKALDKIWESDHTSTAKS